jgi:hypothetical protein
MGSVEEEGSRHHNKDDEQLRALQDQLDALVTEIALQKGRSEMLELLMDDANQAIDDQDHRISGISGELDNMKKSGKWKPDWTMVEKRLGKMEERLKSVPNLDLGKLKMKRGQLGFRMTMIADKQVDTERKIDSLSKLLNMVNESQEEATNEGYSPGIMASVAQHWADHVMDVARVLVPPVPENFCEALSQTMNNVATVSAAAAAVLNLAIDLISLTASAYPLDNTVKAPRAAIRLYSAIYPILRSALMDIGRLPGPICRDDTERLRATVDLRLTLEQMARDAEVVDLTVGIGEPFLGMTNGEKDRWLPEICIGKYHIPHQQILLSSPSTFPVAGEHGLAHRHSLIMAWRNFFARKYPSLVFQTVPLYTNPLFPRVWTGSRLHSVDITSELQNAAITPIEAVEIIISWIGRALIRNAMQQDEESTKWCASSSLRIYNELRPDLVNAINTTLLYDIAHGLQGWIERMEPGKRFLYDVLLKLQEKAQADGRLVLNFGSKPAHGKASADHWLPLVGSKSYAAETDPRPPPLCAAANNGNGT